jgi:hypothetical protein
MNNIPATTKKVQKKPKFSGALNRPITDADVDSECLRLGKIPSYTRMQDDEQFGPDFEYALLSLRAQKLPDLMRHYRIDPDGENALLDLSIALANAHVPGFSFHDKNHWKARSEKFEHLQEIKKLVSEGRSMNKACQVLANRQTKSGQHTNHQNLRRMIARETAGGGIASLVHPKPEPNRRWARKKTKGTPN